MIESKENWNFYLGDFKLTILSDGVFPVTKDFFFSNTPKEMIQHIPNEYEAPLNFLLINTGEKIILIDTGFGEDYLPKRGRLLKQLRQEGISPEDIHTVIITHGHMDHIGGLSRDGVPVFVNADHIIRKEEWDYWMKQPETLEYKKLIPIKKQVRFVSSDIDLYPGIRLIHTPGHTDGHVVVYVHSKENRLLVASDILNDPSTISHLPSHIAAEVCPETGMKTRDLFLQESYSQSDQLFVCHYPFPGLGHVEKHYGEWKWVPLGR